MSYRILLIEDEVAIADSVACSLRNEGFEVEVALDGLAGLSAYRAVSPDLIILDMTLPKLSGLDFCRIVHNESSVPIIMLTAEVEEIDRIVGLEFGADDYVPKPFNMGEVNARVRAVLRRIERARDDQHKTNLDIGPISMDVVRRRVTINGKAVHLPLKQFELLRVLMTNWNRVVNREELFKAVWDAEASYDTGTLDVHIRWLREKIEEDPSRPMLIRTVRGVGYRIVADSES
jgi:two-component system response regulator RegX3